MKADFLFVVKLHYNVLVNINLKKSILVFERLLYFSHFDCL